MLSDLKRLFARSWEAFVTEAGRREPEDQVAEILTSMRREMVEARAALPLYEEHTRKAQAELERERRALDDTMRRGALAQRAGDAETVRIAEEFAERHRKRVAVLEEKVKAAQAEQEMRAQEVQDMMKQYKEADANRFILLNQVKRAHTYRRLDEQREPFDDFDRVAERMESDIAYADALESMMEEEGSPSPPPPQDDVDARLAEMKRRMGLS